jgi:hypothetical protein
MQLKAGAFMASMFVLCILGRSMFVLCILGSHPHPQQRQNPPAAMRLPVL